MVVQHENKQDWSLRLHWSSQDVPSHGESNFVSLGFNLILFVITTKSAQKDECKYVRRKPSLASEQYTNNMAAC